MFDIWETALFEMELYYCFNVYINSIYPHRISSHRTASGTPVKSSQKRKITKESRRRQKSSSANSQKYKIEFDEQLFKNKKLSLRLFIAASEYNC